jgi:hypothetical protein
MANFGDRSYADTGLEPVTARKHRVNAGHPCQPIQDRHVRAATRFYAVLIYVRARGTLKIVTVVANNALAPYLVCALWLSIKLFSLSATLVERRAHREAHAVSQYYMSCSFEQRFLVRRLSGQVRFQAGLQVSFLPHCTPQTHERDHIVQKVSHPNIGI